jgi:cell wall-associated NlpC family hydrolase
VSRRRRKLAVGALVSALCTPGKVMSQTLDRAIVPPFPPAPTGGTPTPLTNAAVAPIAPTAAIPSAKAVVSKGTPLAAFSASASALRDSLVALARAQIGRRYRLGGTTPESGFDCSGFVRYVMAALKVQLPRTANEQSRVGLAVARERDHLRPGDLVTFGSTKRISHIGIYVGDGRFVHASTKAGKVIESPLIRPPNREIKPWRGVRRVIATGDSAAVAGPKKG